MNSQRLLSRTTTGISRTVPKYPEQTVGKTKDEARESLAEAIALILEDRREEGLRGVPPEAIRETVTVS